MASIAVPPGLTAHGGTALGARPDHSRHLLGSALRAVRVYVTTAIEVTVLGNDGKRAW
ncbi:hypothetical protein OG552_14710 [Streptomyces sp. NBC_01476]|uniref:hypothetical protein n=1 Tax=Streptomyces sp. NBC_01476 TaxID=2903881 RepID=UPI002E356005|nr:hypothetical protein [Streptomyces sp. NBC_01476]